MRNIVDIIIILIFVYLVYTILQESAKREKFSITKMFSGNKKKDNENDSKDNKKDYVFFDYDNTLDTPGKDNDISNRIIQPSNYENNQFPSSNILDKPSKDTPQEVKDWQKALSCGVAMTPRYTENDKCDSKKSYNWKLHKPIDKDLERIKSCEDPNLPPTIKELYDRAVTDYKKIIPKNEIGSGWKTQGNYTMDAYTPSGWSYVDENVKDNRMTTKNIYAFDPNFDPYSSLEKHNKLFNKPKKIKSEE